MNPRSEPLAPARWTPNPDGVVGRLSTAAAWAVAVAGVVDPAHLLLVRLVLAGREPAEALPTIAARNAVVQAWHDEGLTDVEMSHRSRWTVHTVRRIRERLGRDAHPSAHPTHWRTAA